jgi:hypothetical protein
MIPGEMETCTCPTFKSGDLCRDYYLLGTCTPNNGYERTYYGDETVVRPIGKMK